MIRAIQLIAVLLIVLVFAGGFWYISGLRADLAVSEENSKKLTEAVDAQQATIKQLQEDQQAIKRLNEDLAKTVSEQNNELGNLRDKFNTSKDGSKRDFAKLAREKPESIERAINKGTVDAFRCIELASGSQATADETNSLCQSFIPETK